MKKLWNWLSKPSTRWPLGIILLAGGIGGILFSGFYAGFMGYTSTLDFCITCHEMEENVYREYQETIHYKNASGVRANCSDCHVPNDFLGKLWRKIKASREVYHKILGTIDTPEKFDRHREAMAISEWKRMKASGSKECLTCHDYEYMAWEHQRRKSRLRMKKAFKEGKICIDCHKGIAHELPEGYEENDDIDEMEEISFSEVEKRYEEEMSMGEEN